MRLVRLSSVCDDMELARDIPSPALGSQPLLRRGVKLSTSIARRLLEMDVRAVWIEDDLGGGIIPAEPLPEHVRRSTEDAVSRCMTMVRRQAAGLSSLPDDAVDLLEEAVSQVVQALENCPEAALAFDDLAHADSYTHTHSVRVATLGMMIGQRMDRLEGWVDYRGRQRFDRRHERMTQLAMGLLIHDIGKIAIPETILNKPSRLTPEEWEIVKQHPTAGASMLSTDRISPLSVCVVRDHHERWDGLGYPQGREGLEIHQFARLAAVADVYDAITADRPYQVGRPPHLGVKVVREGAGTQFDANVVEHFKRIALPYPVGYTIALPDGGSGAVVGVDPEDPDYPVIRYINRSGKLLEVAMHIVDGVVVAGHESTHAVTRPAPREPERGATLRAA
jgi:HD-GYP domain-containing protein (c-di-GMP phosphodiesterase class II)